MLQLAGLDRQHQPGPVVDLHLDNVHVRAIRQIGWDSASVQSVARWLGVDWHTVLDTTKPLLQELADDPAR